MITRDQALAALDKAVEDYGADYVDANALDAAGCLYTRNEGDGVRHCIVGYALQVLGKEVPPPRSKYNALDLHALIEGKGWEDDFSQAAVAALERAQRRQDDGVPWGEAVELAKTYSALADDTKPWGES